MAKTKKERQSLGVRALEAYIEARNEEGSVNEEDVIVDCITDILHHARRVEEIPSLVTQIVDMAVMHVYAETEEAAEELKNAAVADCFL